MKWLVGSLLTLLLAWLLQLGFLVYFCYVLVGVLLVSRYLARHWMEQVSMEQACSGQVLEMGGSAVFTVTLCNRSWIPVPWLLLEQVLPWNADRPNRVRVEGARLHLVGLPPRGSKTIEIKVHFQERGYYRVGPLLMETGDLFGLHRQCRVLANPQCIQVMPRFLALPKLSAKARHRPGEQPMLHRLFEDPTRICGVRPFQSGDPLRRIHWKASARSGQWQTRLLEPAYRAGATVLLDFNLDSYLLHEGAVRAELAVLTVVSILQALLNSGQPAGLICNGRDPAALEFPDLRSLRFSSRSEALTHLAPSLVPTPKRLEPLVLEPRVGEVQRELLLGALARLETAPGLEFVACLHSLTHRLSRNATVLAVLPELSPATANALCGLQAQGYSVAVVLVRGDGVPQPDWAVGSDSQLTALARGLPIHEVWDEDSVVRLATAPTRSRSRSRS